MHVKQVARSIHEHAQKVSEGNWTANDTRALERTLLIVRGFGADILNLYANIVNTSLNEKDKEERIKKLAEDFGFYISGAGEFY